jgi:hypothetical protein
MMAATKPHIKIIVRKLKANFDFNSIFLLSFRHQKVHKSSRLGSHKAMTTRFTALTNDEMAFAGQKRCFQKIVQYVKN